MAVVPRPAATVVLLRDGRDGPEAYAFRENGDFFDRRPVHVLYEDALRDLRIAEVPGLFLSQPPNHSAKKHRRAFHALQGALCPADLSHDRIVGI